MRLLVVGAAGGTGLELCRLAVERNHEVTAQVRTPAKFTAAVNARFSKDVAARLLTAVKVVQADALKPEEQGALLKEGAFDAVLVSLGAAGIMKRDTQCSDGTKNILAALATQSAMASPNPLGGARLVVCSSMGASETKPLMPSFVMWMLKHVLADKDVQEGYIRAARVPYTIARPMRLDDSPRLDYAVAPTGTATASGAISRAATAAFMLDALEKPALIGQAPGLSYPAAGK